MPPDTLANSSLSASVEAYAQCHKTLDAANDIVVAAHRAQQMIDSINWNVGAGNYEYDNYAVDDLRRVQSLLTRAVLEAVARRAR